MLVIKRDGRRESVKFDKVTARIEKLCYGLDMNFINSIDIAKKVIDGIYDGVTTVELDNLAAETSASLTAKHPDYALLAARIAISNLHKVTSKSFSNTMKRLYTYEDPKTGENASLILLRLELHHQPGRVAGAKRRAFVSIRAADRATIRNF